MSSLCRILSYRVYMSVLLLFARVRTEVMLCYEVFERNDIIETTATHFFKTVK